MSKIFGHAPKDSTAAAPTPSAATATNPEAAAPSVPMPVVAAGGAPIAAAAVAPAAAPVAVDVTAILDDLAYKSPEKLAWRTSIVDLLKLVGMDSSLSARKELATDLK